MITYGFYNSKDHDRKYDAIQISSIFDGIIKDGVYMDVGNHLNVISSTGMTVLVDTGRAWFNHTWTSNDSLLPLEVPISEVILKRIDAVVLEVNSEESVRANSIKIVKGTPSSNPSRPAMVNTKTVHQYPLAFINVGAGVTTINQADITNMIGTSSTPFVTGVLQTMNIDTLVAQWKDQWDVFFSNETADMQQTNTFWKNQWRTWFEAQTKEIQEAYLSWENQWNQWYQSQTSEMKEANEYWKSLWQTWFYDYVNNSTKELAYWKKLVYEEWQAYYLQQTTDMQQTNTFWKNQWRTWFEAQTKEIQEAYLSWENQWNQWYQSQTSEMKEANEYWKSLWQTWFYDYVNNSTKEYSDWKNSIDEDFRNWWESLKDLLVGNPDAEFAMELLDFQNRIESLEKFVDTLSKDHSINDTLLGSSSKDILDSDGNLIECTKVVFVVERSLGVSKETDNLIKTVIELSKRIESLETFKKNITKGLIVYDDIVDGGTWLFSNDENASLTEQILDSNGNPIEGRVMLVVK